MRFLWVALVAGLTVSACGGQAPQTAASQNVTTTVTLPGVNTRYHSVYDIRLAVGDGGFVCSAWEILPSSEFSIETASCAGVLVFAVYENAGLIVEHRELRNDLLASVIDVSYDLAGPNWSVTCEDRKDLCEALLPLLGGEMIVSELTEP